MASGWTWSTTPTPAGKSDGATRRASECGRVVPISNARTSLDRNRRETTPGFLRRSSDTPAPSPHVGPHNETLASSGDIYHVLCSDYERHGKDHVASRRGDRCVVVGNGKRGATETIGGGVAIEALIGCNHPRIHAADKGKDRDSMDACQLCKWMPLVQRAKKSDSPKHTVDEASIRMPFVCVSKHLSELDELMRWRCLNVSEAETCLTYFNMRFEQKRSYAMYNFFCDHYAIIRNVADDCREVFQEYHERDARRNRTLEFQDRLARAGNSVRTTSRRFYCAHVYAPKALSWCKEGRPYIHKIELFAPSANDLAKYHKTTLDIPSDFVACLIGASHLMATSQSDMHKKINRRRSMEKVLMSVVDKGRNVRERTRPLSASVVGRNASQRGNAAVLRSSDPRDKRNADAIKRHDIVKAYGKARPSIFILSNLPELEERSDYVIRRGSDRYCNVLELMTPEDYYGSDTL